MGLIAIRLTAGKQPAVKKLKASLRLNTEQIYVTTIVFTFLSVQNKYNDVLLKRGGPPPFVVGWKGREASGSSLKVILPLWPAFGPPPIMFGRVGGWLHYKF